MLTSLELDNYRGFTKYRVAGLSRVNLLVGMNNCGKTSVLEAIQLLASGGDPSVLLRIAHRRGETVPSNGEPDHRRFEVYPVASHFFHGHEFSPGVCLTIRADDAHVVLTVTDQEQALHEDQIQLFALNEDVPYNLALVFEVSTLHRRKARYGIPVSDEGMISSEYYKRMMRRDALDRNGLESVKLITSDSLGVRSMHQMWDRVIIEGQEANVIKALRVLEPRLTNIFFLTRSQDYGYGSSGGILVELEGARRRDPLGTYGDGMRRLLALSTSIIEATGGFLLVDEIDTGLHYSIMGDMWRLITRAAIESDVQVFATTHSLDCVRGLAWLCEQHTDLRDKVSLQKIDTRLEEAAAFDGQNLMIAADQDIEVR